MDANANPRPLPAFLAGTDTGPGRGGGPHSPEVRALLESGPRAAAHSKLAERNGFLRLQLHGYQASFLTATLRNLAHFLEDDTRPQVLPMEISVRDTHVNLKVRGVAAAAPPGLLFPSRVAKCCFHPEAAVARLPAELQKHTRPSFPSNSPHKLLSESWVSITPSRFRSDA